MPTNTKKKVVVNKKRSKSLASKPKFSKQVLFSFGAVFAAVGGYFLYQTFAASAIPKSYTNGKIFVPSAKTLSVYTAAGVLSKTITGPSQWCSGGGFSGTPGDENVGVTGNGQKIYAQCSKVVTPGQRQYWLEMANTTFTSKKTIATWTQIDGGSYVDKEFVFGYAVNSTGTKVALSVHTALNQFKIRIIDVATGGVSYLKMIGGPVPTDPTIISAYDKIEALAYVPGDTQLIFKKDRYDYTRSEWSFDMCQLADNQAMTCKTPTYGTLLDTYVFYGNYANHPYNASRTKLLMMGNKRVIANGVTTTDTFEFNWADATVKKLAVPSDLYSTKGVTYNRPVGYSPDSKAVFYNSYSVTYPNPSSPSTVTKLNLATGAKSSFPIIFGQNAGWQPVPVY